MSREAMARRIVSVADAVRMLPGRTAAVLAWLYSERLVFKAPFGPRMVDLDTMHARLLQVAQVVLDDVTAAQDAEFAADLGVPPAPVTQQRAPKAAARPKRTRRAIGPPAALPRGSL